MLHTDITDPDSNPPGTWQVIRRGERSWSLADAAGAEIEHYTTRRAAEAALIDGWAVRLWRQESAWMRGETVTATPGRLWRPYADVLADHRRSELRDRFMRDLAPHWPHAPRYFDTDEAWRAHRRAWIDAELAAVTS